jgi:hypothetical protein
MVQNVKIRSRNAGCRMPLLVLVVCIITTDVLAQENYFYVNWDVNKPLSNTNWIENTSSRGGRAGYRVMLGEGSFGVGLDFNWTFFDQYEPTKTIPNGNGAITTDYFRFVHQYGLTASGQYYLPVGEREIVFPYAGLGLGANYNQYILQYNIYENSEEGWGFLARPELGVLVRFGAHRSIGAMAAVHYDFSTNKSRRYNYDHFSMAGFSIGLIFMGH